MAHPKVKTSKSKRDTRRSHHALKPKQGSNCANCGAVKHSHSVCESCGHYRGKQVVSVKSPALKDESFSVDS
jgi:large subunit ribosomal protein L32